MRRFLAILALLAISLPSGAAPLSGRTPRTTEPIHAQEAQGFAQALLHVAGEINRFYVRPVPLRNLLYTALAGLYQEARLPVPEGLRAEVAKAVPEPVADDIQVAGVFPEIGAEAIALTARVRMRLGNNPALNGDHALWIGIQAMVHSLDPYCSVLDGEALRRGTGENVNHGVGLNLLPNDGNGPVLVKTVLPGGSAQRKGVRPGDQITHVNDQTVEGQDAEGVRRRIDGDPSRAGGQRVVLTLRRAGRPKPWKVALEARHFQPEMVLGVRRNPDDTWNYYADPDRKLALVRIGALDHGVSEELRQVLATLKTDGMKGLILDLRWGPGGFLNEAVLLSRLFFKEGVIARVKNRIQREDQEFRAQAFTDFARFPLVVLVNGETSGGSELVAAALQDNQRAVVVGQRTFGKASVQTMLALPLPNTGLKLTSGSFLRPSGKALHRFPDSKWSDDWGVRPDGQHALPITADLSRQLREWWRQLSIRPARDNDALPLDDLEKDPQLQAALTVLADQVKKNK